MRKHGTRKVSPWVSRFEGIIFGITISFEDAPQALSMKLSSFH
jgi:hypothetical protein